MADNTNKPTIFVGSSVSGGLGMDPAKALSQATMELREQLCEDAARYLGGTFKRAPEDNTYKLELAVSYDSGYYEPTNPRAGGKPVQTKLVSVNGVRLEYATGYDYYLMAIAAAADGITLLPYDPVDGAFRHFDQQVRLYEARKKTADEQGAAADPWHRVSNHQRGLAMDISTGISRPEYIPKVGPTKRTLTFDWLEKNAHKFGFNHTEGHNIGEAWHWVHTNDGKIYGLNALEGIKLPAVQAAELGSYKKSKSTKGFVKWYLEPLAGSVQAAARAKLLKNATRAQVFEMALKNKLDTMQKNEAARAHTVRALTAVESAKVTKMAPAEDVVYDPETRTMIAKQ